MGDAIDKLIDDVEAGRPVDWKRAGLLIDLEFVRLDREFVRDSLQRQKAADEQLNS